MRRAFVIRNPVASRSTPRGLEQAQAVFAEAGMQAESAQTEAPDGATRMAAEAASDGFEIIVVYGGDGTVMQAVAGIHGTNATLGIIPGGTGNLLASNLGIPRNPARAAAIIARGTPRHVDLLRLETSTGERFVSVGAGTGYDAEMMAATTAEKKRRWGVGAYIGFVLRTAPFVASRPVTISIDGETTRHEAAVVLVANCPLILPPVLQLGPEVALDDGVLDVIVLRANGLWQTTMAVWNVFRLQETPRVQRLRGREIRVETDSPQRVQADGDLCGETPLRASIVESGLSVMSPR